MSPRTLAVPFDRSSWRPSSAYGQGNRAAETHPGRSLPTIEASRWRPGQLPEPVAMEGLTPSADAVLVLRLDSAASDARMSQVSWNLGGDPR